MFAALSSPVRRETLRLLREHGPQPVAELAAHFAMARPSYSEHLRVLRDAGLASETKVGRQIAEQYPHLADGIEVTEDVFESPANLSFEQAENRMHTIKALLVSSLA